MEKKTYSDREVLDMGRKALKRFSIRILAESDPKKKAELEKRYKKLEADMSKFLSILVKEGPPVQTRVEVRAYDDQGNLLNPNVKFY